MGSKKKEKVNEVGWRLDNHKAYFDEKQVRGELLMPSLSPKGYKGEWVGELVRLDRHSQSEDTTHALAIMRDSRSSNILWAKLVLEDKSQVLAWVEPFTGNLLDYLESKILGISVHIDQNSEFTLPTPNLRSAIRQVIEGLEDLKKSGHYHGGFTLAKTYYVMAPSGIMIKLCNFRKKKEGTFQKKLAEDWWALKDGLVEIKKIADILKHEFPYIDCCQLDGLINVLKNIGPFNAESAFEVVKRQPFFWGKMERKEFFVCVIPLALSKPDFWSNVDQAEFISLPWGGTDKISGLLQVMNTYRATQRQEDYKTSCRVDFVKCISGLYTHENLLMIGVRVDLTIQSKHPGLCYRLYALLPHANTVGT